MMRSWADYSFVVRVVRTAVEGFDLKNKRHPSMPFLRFRADYSVIRLEV